MSPKIVNVSNCVSKHPTWHRVTGAENTVRRDDYYMQRRASHILVCTAAGELVLADVEVPALFQEIQLKEGYMHSEKKGTAGEVITTTNLVVFYQFMLKIIISVNSSIKTLQNISRRTNTSCLAHHRY